MREILSGCVLLYLLAFCWLPDLPGKIFAKAVKAYNVEMMK